MSPDDDETTPCPHCLWGYYTMHGASEDGRHGEVTRWQVVCDGCGATGPADLDSAAALDAWLNLSALRTRAEAAEHALATARAEGAAAMLADILALLGQSATHDRAEARRIGGEDRDALDARATVTEIIVNALSFRFGCPVEAP